MQPFLINLTRLGADADFSLMPGLFPPELRPHVLAFSHFVRLADHIADSTALTRQEKIARLEVLEASLLDQAAAKWSEDARQVTQAMARSLSETNVSPDHCLRMVQAFRRDVVGIRKRTWDDLLAYCRDAAAPIGRYMLELLGEDQAACAKRTDSLCAALRILKRLRDCRHPIVQFNRLCIPEQFMEDALVSIHHLEAPSAKGQTRAVIDRVVDGVDHLLDQAAPLPILIRSQGLRMHTGIVMCRGRKLAERCRENDPLRGRVTLTRWERFRCRWSVIVPGLLERH